MNISKKSMNEDIERYKKYNKNTLYKSQKELFKNLLLLNGSGLIACLAFIGQIFGKCIPVPFYSSSIFFATGVASIFLYQLLFYFSTVTTYHQLKNIVEPFNIRTYEFSKEEISKAKMFLDPKNVALKMSALSKVFVSIGLICFIIGAFKGIIDLNKINYYSELCQIK